LAISILPLLNSLISCHPLFRDADLSELTSPSGPFADQNGLSDQYPAVYRLDHFPALVEVSFKLSFSDKFVLVSSGIFLFPEFLRINPQLPTSD
jgi:hypothetical protein